MAATIRHRCELVGRILDALLGQGGSAHASASVAHAVTAKSSLLPPDVPHASALASPVAVPVVRVLMQGMRVCLWHAADDWRALSTATQILCGTSGHQFSLKL